MSATIKGKEYPLFKIFSSDFDFDIPPYQRPYAWTEEQTGKLFDDLFEAYKDRDLSEDNYFLGSIVLIKDENTPHADVIDGQQRLTTLTIFLSVLASKLPEASAAELRDYILEKGKKFEGLKSRPRLRIRNRDNEFFEKYIQGIKIEELIKLEPANQDTEAKGNIIVNAKLLSERIDQNFSSTDEIDDFCTFLMTKCFLVAVSTSSEQSAYRVFSVMNSRGLSLLATDIIKATVIGAIDDEKRDAYTQKWENLETDLGRDGFNDLFGQLRMISMKKNQKKTLQEEFLKEVLPKLDHNVATQFIDHTLDPYANAYLVIKNAEYSSKDDAESVNGPLLWLNRIDNTDWVPVAMYYYNHHKDDTELLAGFFKKLERLAAYMRATSWDIHHRVQRYAKILTELESLSCSEFGLEIELTEEEKVEFIKQLNSDIYTMTSNKRNYLILRLDSFVSDNAATYKTQIFTIEHVLPQTPKENSEWTRLWTDEQRKYWIHKIGNLVPLARRKNSEAQNYEFEEKKVKYFTGRNGTSAYALTTQVLQYNEWTPDVVEKRQEFLLGVFKKNWDL